MNFLILLRPRASMDGYYVEYWKNSKGWVRRRVGVRANGVVTGGEDIDRQYSGRACMRQEYETTRRAPVREPLA